MHIKLRIIEVREIIKECNLQEGKENYMKLLIKICNDNNVSVEKIKEFYQKA